MHATRLQDNHRYYTINLFGEMTTVEIHRTGQWIFAQHGQDVYRYDHKKDLFVQVLPFADTLHTLQSHDWTLVYNPAPPSSAFE